MNHPQRFRIIGFLDTAWKWRGTWQSTHFRPEDCFEADHIPNKDAMIAYATARGYWPSGKEGSTLEKCEALYTVIGDELGYQDCELCFGVRSEVIANGALA